MKRTLALALSLLMLLSLIPMAGAASFTDTASITATATEAVDVMSDLKIITGFPDGSFKPEDTLTRAQAAKIICCVALGTEAADALSGAGSTFSDVPASHWANKYVEYCASNGIVSGVGNGAFNPDGKLTGYAFGKMLLGVLGADVSALTGADWEKNTGSQMMARHLNYGVTVSNKGLSRQDACRLALNALFDGEKEGADKTLASKVFKVSRKSADGKRDLSHFCRPNVTYVSDAADAYWTGTEKKLVSSPVFVRPTGALTGGDICRIFGVDSIDYMEQLKVYRNGNGGKLKTIGDVFHTDVTKTYLYSGNNVRLELFYCADLDKYFIIHIFPYADRIASVTPAQLAADGTVQIAGSVTFENGMSCNSNDFTDADVGKFAYFYASCKSSMNSPTEILEVRPGTIVTGTLTAYDAKTGLSLDNKKYTFCTQLGKDPLAKKYLENGGAIGDIVNVLLTDDGFVASVWQ